MNPVQRLLVEGDNDIHVIANLALAKGLPKIQGYETPKKFEKQFAIIGNGIDGVKERIPTILKTEGLTNFGIVLDADANVQAIWEAIKHILSDVGFQNLPKVPEVGGTLIFQAGKPKLGIWIMPDNQNSGYLENFLKKMIPDGDNLLLKAETIIQELMDNEWNKFSKVKRTKAEIHTWLAWQPTPGMPMGMAISANYFDCNTELATRFLTWLQAIFEFEMPQTPDNQ